MGVEEATKFICKLRFKQTGKDLWKSVCEYVDNLKKIVNENVGYKEAGK